MTQLNQPTASSADSKGPVAGAVPAGGTNPSSDVSEATEKSRAPNRWLVLAVTPEAMALLLLIIAFAISASLVPHFLDAQYLLDRSSLYMETGIMAVAMTFVIVGGHIDLSCASMLALVGAVITLLNARYHVPMVPLLLLAPVLGAILGAVNGITVAKLGLPSLVVTLATMATYRGLAQVLIGDSSVSPPEWFKGIDSLYLGPSPVPMPMVIWLSLALTFGLVLHRTVAGRWIFSMGISPGTSLYSGVPVSALTIGIFMLSGVLSAVAGLIMVSRLGVARYDSGAGLELDVITAVVLGGANIFGGRGTMFGTVIALLLIAVLQTAMGVANIKAEYQATANGALLIFAVLASNLIAHFRK